MNAFSQALGTLLADLNMGTSAEWQAAAGGSWVPVRVIVSAPSEGSLGFGRAGTAVAKNATLSGADLPALPKRGDHLRWGAPVVTYRVETSDPDALGLSWRLGLVTTA